MRAEGSHEDPKLMLRIQYHSYPTHVSDHTPQVPWLHPNLVNQTELFVRLRYIQTMGSTSYTAADSLDRSTRCKSGELRASSRRIGYYIWCFDQSWDCVLNIRALTFVWRAWSCKLKASQILNCVSELTIFCQSSYVLLVSCDILWKRLDQTPDVVGILFHDHIQDNTRLAMLDEHPGGFINSVGSAVSSRIADVLYRRDLRSRFRSETIGADILRSHRLDDSVLVDMCRADWLCGGVWSWSCYSNRELEFIYGSRVTQVQYSHRQSYCRSTP